MKQLGRILVTSIFITMTTLSYAGEEGAAEAKGEGATTETKGEEATPAKTHSCSCTKNIFTGSMSGNFDFTTNYIFRGVSNSNNLPAAQGGLTYTLESSGIYLNLWGSNVNFPAPQGETATVEFDTVIGITNDVCTNFNYNLSFARYNYPKAGSANYNEAIGVFTYYFLVATVGYAPNVYGSHGPGTYTSIGISYDLPCEDIYFKDVTVNATVGHYRLPKRAGKTYNDYSAGISKKIKNYTLAVLWTDTNHRFTNNSLDHAHLIGTVTVDF